METKICTKCNKEYPATSEYFYVCRTAKDGLRSICKVCDKKRWAENSAKKQAEKQKEQQLIENDLKSRGVKICPKCKRELPAKLEYFYSNASLKDGLSFWCKSCSKQITSVWRQENYDVIIEKQRARYKENLKNIEFISKQKEYDKQYYQEHKDQKQKYVKQYSKEHADKIKAYNKMYCNKNRQKLLEYSKIYYQENKEQIKEYQRKYAIEHKEELSIKNKLRHQNNKITRNFSWAINHALKGSKSGQHWEDLVPYNLEQLKQHLESQFTPSMNWNNYGSYWEVDHIIPQNTFNFSSYTDKEFQICWSLLNLRPLTIYENRSRPKDGSDVSDDIRNKIMKG